MDRVQTWRNGTQPHKRRAVSREEQDAFSVDARDHRRRATPALVAHLQRTAGNQAVQRLLAGGRSAHRAPAPGRVPGLRLPTPARTAAAGAALGQSRPTVQRGCGGKQAKMPPLPTTTSDARLNAKNMIKNSDMRREWKQRALDILNAPDIIQQGAFGICAIVSVLRHVVINDPEEFATMTLAAVADNSNRKARMPAFRKRATKDQKRDHAELEYLVAHWFVRQGKKSDPYRTTYKNQKTFSNEFNGVEGIKNWKKEGHFGMTAGGLKTLVDKANKGRGSQEIRVTNLVKDYGTARATAGPSGAVIASVTDTRFYEKASPRTKAAKATMGKSGPLDFVHWIMLEDVTQSGALVSIRLWTWGGEYTPTVDAGVVNGYFHSLVAAQGK